MGTGSQRVSSNNFIQSNDKAGCLIQLQIALTKSTEMFHQWKKIGKLCGCAILGPRYTVN